MSLFGSPMGDFEEDPFFGAHMRHANSVMSSLMFDSFGMPDFGLGNFPFGGMRAISQNSLLPRPGFPVMPPMNRLLSNSLNSLGDSHCYSSSTVYSMSSGPDGRPHVYKATSSMRTAPGGVRETQKTECDSASGTKKMSIGHHIGDRAHIVEREENVRSGDQEEREDFINLEEEEADDFNREWETKTRRSEIPRITGASSLRNRYSYGDRDNYVRGLPALTAGPSRRSRERSSITNPLVPSRRSIRSSPLTSSNNASMSSARHPYSAASHSQSKKSKNIKTVTGSPPADM